MVPALVKDFEWKLLRRAHTGKNSCIASVLMLPLFSCTRWSWNILWFLWGFHLVFYLVGKPTNCLHLVCSVAPFLCLCCFWFFSWEASLFSGWAFVILHWPRLYFLIFLSCSSAHSSAVVICRKKRRRVTVHCIRACLFSFIFSEEVLYSAYWSLDCAFQGIDLYKQRMTTKIPVTYLLCPDFHPIFTTFHSWLDDLVTILREGACTCDV